MRRFALVMTAGTVWLFLFAIPAFADNGPHVKGQFNTSLAGSCAGCHRAHSGQAPMLLKTDVLDLCYTCHSGTGGSQVDVKNGVYDSSGDALRGGGFALVKIDHTNSLNTSWHPTPPTLPKGDSNASIGVLSSTDTVSHHSISGDAVSMWGSGVLGSTASYTVTTKLECVSCHDPHGNGQYRILKPSPNDVTTGTSPVYINDDPASIGTRTYVTSNYGTLGSAGVSESALNVAGNSAPNGPKGSVTDGSAVQYVPASAAGASVGYFKGGYIEASSRWCATCHTRYFGTTGSAGNKTWTDTGRGDPTFKFAHATRDIVDPGTAFAGSPSASAVLSPLGAGSVLFSQIKPRGYVELDRTTNLPTGWVVTSDPSIGDIPATSTSPKYAGVAIVTETWTDPGSGGTPPNPPPTVTTKIVSALGSATGALDLLAGSAPRCITCHVSHGSNASDSLTGFNVQNSIVTGADLHSPLLRLDGRAVCQNCHNK